MIMRGLDANLRHVLNIIIVIVFAWDYVVVYIVHCVHNYLISAKCPALIPDYLSISSYVSVLFIFYNKMVKQKQSTSTIRHI